MKQKNRSSLQVSGSDCQHVKHIFDDRAEIALRFVFYFIAKRKHIRKQWTNQWCKENNGKK